MRIHRRVCSALLTAVLCLALLPAPARAAGAAGLAAFEDAKEYLPGTFTDVSQGTWYEPGVKTVYAKGIMDGVGGGAFGPTGTVTWTQAVTIAARLHAIYNGVEIPAVEGVWYARYLDYAEKAGLLPETHPGVEAANTTDITRQELAALFRNVLSDADLPVINNATAADIGTVKESYRKAVEDMYASGIFTGKTGGYFDPEGITTRAEIAVVVTRLLCPAQRVSHDSRANQAMADQYGNFLMGGIAVTDGNATYYIVYETKQVDEEEVNFGTLVARTDDGEVRELYSTEDRLSYLSLGDDGKLYAMEENSLLRIDPATGKKEALYTAKLSLESYTLYDGEIYLCEQSKDSSDYEKWLYRIGRLNGKTLDVLMDNIKQGEALYLDSSLYCFGGKLYFLYGDSSYKSSGYEFHNYSLWSIDLKSKQKEKVMDGSGDSLLYFSEIAYSGATVWFLGGDQDGARTLKRANLLMPALVETVTELPEAARKSYIHMYANGSQLYYHSSGARQLWKVSSSGSFTELAPVETQYTEYSTVTPQVVITHGLKWLYLVYGEEMDAYLPDGSEQSYYQFLGRPYLEKGIADLTAAYGEKTWEVPDMLEDTLLIQQTREYRTEAGDYVAEMMVLNGYDKTIPLATLNFRLDVGDLHLSRALLADTIAAKGTQAYTFVVPAAALGEAVNETEFELDWGAYFWDE